MDYQNDNDKEWQREGIHLKNRSNHDMANCLVNDVIVTQNEEDMSYLFEENTPIKACGDLAYFYDNSEIMIKASQESKGYTSQVMQRRILDFDIAANDISSAFLKSKERIGSFETIDNMPEISQWEACLQEDLCLEDLAQSEAWIADCFIDTDMNISSEDGNCRNASVASDIHHRAEDVCNDTPHPEPIIAQRPVRSSRNFSLKGRKSYMRTRTPTKLASSVAYPFEFIKPCGVRGDVTLKDINHRILAPPPAKRKLEEEHVYPTSAFSGKSVVGRTKISTQGGKGSITIMRTQG